MSASTSDHGPAEYCNCIHIHRSQTTWCSLHNLMFTCAQVCNTLGQCHCDSCFDPPDCSQPGRGGSYHSNPACAAGKYTLSIKNG